MMLYASVFAQRCSTVMARKTFDHSSTLMASTRSNTDRPDHEHFHGAFSDFLSELGKFEPHVLTFALKMRAFWVDLGKERC